MRPSTTVQVVKCKQSHLDKHTSGRSAPVDVESLGFDSGVFVEKDVIIQCHALAMATNRAASPNA